MRLGADKRAVSVPIPFGPQAAVQPPIPLHHRGPFCITSHLPATAPPGSSVVTGQLRPAPSPPPTGNRWVTAFPLFLLGSMCLSESSELPVPGGGARAPRDMAGVNAAGHSLGLCCSNWATRTQKRRRKQWSPGAYLLPGGKMRIYDPWKHKTVQWKAETEGGVQ